MSTKNTFLAFTFISLLFSCNNTVNTTFSYQSISTPNNKLVEVNIPKAEGNSTISKNINSAINKTVSAAVHIGEDKPNANISIEENIERFNTEYNNFAKDFPESTFPWEAQIDGEVIFESPQVISISITSYTNTGGAHGNVYVTFLNFDAETGNRLKNENLFKNKEEFETIAKTYFNTSIDDKNILFEPETFKIAENIAFSEDGIILLYNTYEIAPYSAGIIEFIIPADKINDYLAINSPY